MEYCIFLNKVSVRNLTAKCPCMTETHVSSIPGVAQNTNKTDINYGTLQPRIAISSVVIAIGYILNIASKKPD